MVQNGIFDSGDVLPLTGSEITTLLEDTSRLKLGEDRAGKYSEHCSSASTPTSAPSSAPYTGGDDIPALVEPVILAAET